MLGRSNGVSESGMRMTLSIDPHEGHAGIALVFLDGKLPRMTHLLEMQPFVLLRDQAATARAPDYTAEAAKARLSVLPVTVLGNASIIKKLRGTLNGSIISRQAARRDGSFIVLPGFS